MSLSTSRQQFLAYEPNAEPEGHRKGGVFVSTCICVGFVIFAVLAAALVGIIVYFITYFKVSQKPTDFWNEMEPFGEPGPPSPDLRLPPYVVPSFYRLKLKADLTNSTFSGEVYITLKASKAVNEIILHAKNLTINSTPKLTEQIYENVETIHERAKREAEGNITDTVENSTDISNFTTESPSNATTGSPDVDNVTDSTVNMTETPEIIIDTQVTHSNVRNILVTSFTEGEGDRLTLSLASPLIPDIDYILELSFEGQILNSLTGFYKSSYVNNNNEIRQLAVTQFEPTSARAAFPCFDEPAFKAKFEISIAHDKNLTVLSNMKVISQEPIPEEPSWQWTHFDRSVRMSTYLVAYVLCDFKSVETSYTSMDNITKTIKVWTRPELIGKANYALSITPKLLAYYEEMFGVPYALDKLDLIAIPDFSSGAMENWGLITFRETTLLFDERAGSPRERQGVAVDVAHELAHQWLGNLATLRWWTDLWLNEGLATYVEYVGVDKIEPAWNMLETLTRDKMELLRSDALKNTAPVSRLVADVAGIAQKFDEISYNKGASLIRMLNYTITEPVFLKGIGIYLNKWKYANAEENDLWAAMAEALRAGGGVGGAGGVGGSAGGAGGSAGGAGEGPGVVRFMNSWTRQAGYPVVEVQRDYGTGLVTFRQKLFTSSPSPYQSMVEQVWHVPVSWAAGGEAGRLWLSDRTAMASVPANGSQALYVNVDAIGYYRVNYDKRNWKLLSEALESGAISSPVAKAQLIDDAFNLAKAGQLDYGLALGLTTCVIPGEDSRMVWDTVLNNMAFLHLNLRATPGYVYFQDYMRLLVSKQLQKLNYGLEQPADDNEAFLAENLVMWECLVEAPRCLAWARGLFDEWMARADPNDNPIPSYLRAVVYSTAVKGGGRREFEFLWRRSRAGLPAEQALALSVLPATRDEGLLTFLLEKSITDLPKQYVSMAWGVEGPGTRVAQDFLVENFPRVHARLAAIDGFSLSAALAGAFGAAATPEELKRLKSFALHNKAQLLPVSQTLQKLVDSAAARVAWRRRHAPAAAAWLRAYVTEHAPANSFSSIEQPLTETITINITESTTHSPDATTTNPPANVTTSESAGDVTTTNLPSNTTTTNSPLNSTSR